MDHNYTIDQAIRDGNILDFHVDYVSTGKFKIHTSLREELVDNRNT
ncbi:hypothetical protein [Atopobacter phocae]|nr:hypothetical protein [Atopobacter phocae]